MVSIPFRGPSTYKRGLTDCDVVEPVLAKEQWIVVDFPTWFTFGEEKAAIRPKKQKKQFLKKKKMVLFKRFRKKIFYTEF